MANVAIPQTRVNVSTYQIDSFLGIDMTNAPANVNKSRSPSAPNMIRDTPGKVRKRMGYQTVRELGGRINGRHVLRTVSAVYELVHVGTTLMRGDDVVYKGMNDTRSQAVQLETKLYIFDGKAALVYDGAQVKRLDADPYIPTIVIGREPSGGGTPYEPVNLMGDGFREEFQGDGSSTLYQLSLDGLSNAPVPVQVMNADGEWNDLEENTDYTVDRTNGTVTFTTAPATPPVSGQDNVRITAYKDRTESRSKINGCTVCVLYGVNGALDRIFVTGNPDYPNTDWYCGYNNPRMWGDLWYGVVGQDDAPIIGYSVVNNLLAAHKSNGANGSNVVLRSGTLSDDNEAQFSIVNTLQGEGAVAPHSFAVIGTEPVFLTEAGVYAITANDTTGERFAQNRSFFINRPLEQLENKHDVFGMVSKDFYYLCTDNGVYILDGLVKTFERGKPYSSYQYEAYWFPDISARVMWEAEDGALMFGTADGRVNRFYTNKEDADSYNDNGLPISAWWEIPTFSGDVFYTNKTIRYVAAQLASATRTSIQFMALIKNNWKILKEKKLSAQWFAFSKIEWSRFSWGSNRAQRTIGIKAKLRKLDAAQLRIRNEQLNESFGLYSIGFEFVETGKFKER